MADLDAKICRDCKHWDTADLTKGVGWCTNLEGRKVKSSGHLILCSEEACEFFEPKMIQGTFWRLENGKYKWGEDEEKDKQTEEDEETEKPEKEEDAFFL